MKRTSLMRTVAVVAAVFAGGAQAAEMTIFQGRDFRGPSYTLKGNANLADIDFQNKVSSIVVRSGTWDVCTEPDLAGQCATLYPGEYPVLNSRLNDRIESMRVVDRQALSQRQGLVIYSQPNFGGKAVDLKGDAATLVPHGIQDQASSLKIRAGRWEFCTQPNFAGDCVTLASGDYPTLEQRLNHRIESVREVDRVVADRSEPDYRRQRDYASGERSYDHRERDNNRDRDYGNGYNYNDRRY
jgi:hypothetical protein